MERYYIALAVGATLAVAVGGLRVYLIASGHGADATLTAAFTAVIASVVALLAFGRVAENGSRKGGGKDV